MKIVCIIPARLHSSRFPQKILKALAGKPLLQWVWEAANRCHINSNPFALSVPRSFSEGGCIEGFSNIIFAIDSKKTAQLIKSFGGKYIMTSQDCKCGTDRLVELVKDKKVDGDIFVNWQADEPFITKQMIGDLLQSCKTDNADMWTLKKRITKKEEITSVNVAKVVCDKNNFALYFSRNPIPRYRDDATYSDTHVYYKHLGIFAYRKETLLKIDKLDQCYLEDAEKLEQLRFLSNNISVKLHDTDGVVVGIDTKDDLKKAEKFAQLINRI
jgi:3-deoxy-manno-octulosonate cytidylyltransferase (CMP-KDO synthetase)